MKSSTKGAKSLSAYSGDPHLSGFSTGSAIGKLSRIHGLSKKGGSLKSSTLLSPHPVAVTCERWDSPEPPFGGRRSGTPETSKASEIDPEDPKRSGSPSGHRSLWREFKNSGRNIRFSKTRLAVLLRREGFTVSSKIKWTFCNHGVPPRKADRRSVQ